MTATLGLLALVAAALGLIFGSFANVLVLRAGTGRSLGGRSRCLSCGRALGVVDLVPVLSWLFLRGRCRSRECRSPISWQYPAVELAAAVGFLAAWRHALSTSAAGALGSLEYLLVGAAVLFAISAAVVFLWVSLAAYDVRHMVIPDRWSYLAAALALLAALLGAGQGGLLAALSAGPLVALPLFLLWLVSGGRWMGLGDPKLALSVGWLLGASGGFLALVLAVFAGAAAGLAWLGVRRLRRDPRAGRMSTAMPFGPFIVLGALAVLWTGAGLGDLVGAVGSLFLVP